MRPEARRFSRAEVALDGSARHVGWFRGWTDPCGGRRCWHEALGDASKGTKFQGWGPRAPSTDGAPGQRGGSLLQGVTGERVRHPCLASGGARRGHLRQPQD